MALDARTDEAQLAQLDDELSAESDAACHNVVAE